MKNITIGGRYFPGVRLVAARPDLEGRMLGPLATVPETKFDLVTLDGLGTYKPRRPAPKPSSTSPASGRPAPSGSPKAHAERHPAVGLAGAVAPARGAPQAPDASAAERLLHGCGHAAAVRSAGDAA
jgi:hypothetical protein